MDYQRRLQIRQAYFNSMDRILSGELLNVYEFTDWRDMTKIEDNVWCDIRCAGLAFYPQFPIGKYNVDFADPINKIVIEVDGKEWHTDFEKDKKRQNEIEALGWEVIRINGRNTFKCRKKDNEEDDYEEEKEEVNCNCSYCLLWALRVKLVRKYYDCHPV